MVLILLSSLYPNPLPCDSCRALPLWVEHASLPCDFGFNHGFASASRMRQKWRCFSSKPNLQQAWVLPLASVLLPLSWEECAQASFWFLEVHCPWSRAIPANSTCIIHPKQPQMWEWSPPSPAWISWPSCNPQVTHRSMRWKDVCLSHWVLGCFCYAAHLAIAVQYKI